MSRKILVIAPLLSILAFAPACDTDDDERDFGAGTLGMDDDGVGEDDGEEQELPEPPEELVEMFEQAGEEFGVPAIILTSIGQVETGWQMVYGVTEFEGKETAVGLMALRGADLEQGAALAGVSVAEASNDPLANIRAAAALLSSMADELGIQNRDDYQSWGPVLAAYSGIEGEEGQQAYVEGEVFPAVTGELPQTVVGLDTLGLQGPDQGGLGGTPGPDYAASIWRPSPNNSARPGGSAGDPSMVIIHTCEGSYSGCWSWLKNPNAGVSAHYVVNNTGTEITQLVAENRKAWHIGASYKCSLNSQVDCGKNGSSSNNFTIGIEHAGYANQASWDSNLIDASAQLVCDITADQGIVRDKYHIVGHGQLQPYNRIDPGPNWPWNDYLALIQSYCDGGQPDPQPEPEPEPEPDPQPEPDPEPEPDPLPEPDPEPVSVDIIVDSNNALNGSNAEMWVSNNWVSSSGPTDWQTGYWWHSTQAISDKAEFAFYLEEDAQLVVEAWWTQGSNRSAAAPFIMYDSSENQLETVYVNQQQGGGQWNNLGTYNFKAGWNHVDLSVWAAAGYVVVADAVRVHTP